VRSFRCPLRRWSRSGFHTRRRSTCNTTLDIAAYTSPAAEETLCWGRRREQRDCWVRRRTSSCTSSLPCRCQCNTSPCLASASRRTATVYVPSHSAVRPSRTSLCNRASNRTGRIQQFPCLKPANQTIKYKNKITSTIVAPWQLGWYYVTLVCTKIFDDGFFVVKTKLTVIKAEYKLTECYKFRNLRSNCYSQNRFRNNKHF